MIKVKGLPFNAWTQENLKKKKLRRGSWGWWVNRTDPIRKLKKLRICLYNDHLGNVLSRIMTKVKGVGYMLGLEEVVHEFKGDNCALEEMIL